MKNKNNPDSHATITEEPLNENKTALIIRRYTNKFKALIRSKDTSKNNNIKLATSTRTIHLAKNPKRGGIPANLTIIKSISSFLTFRKEISSMEFVKEGIKTENTKIKETQYKKVNKRKILKPMEILNIIHLKLKIDE